MALEGPHTLVVNKLTAYIQSNRGWTDKAKVFLTRVQQIDKDDLQTLKAETSEFCCQLHSLYNSAVGETGAYLLSYIPGLSEGSQLKKELEIIIGQIPEQKSTIFQPHESPATISTEESLDEAHDEEATKNPKATQTPSEGPANDMAKESQVPSSGPANDAHTPSSSDEGQLGNSAGLAKNDKDKAEAEPDWLDKLATKIKSFKFEKTDKPDPALLVEQNRMQQLTIEYLSDELASAREKLAAFEAGANAASEPKTGLKPEV